MSTMDDLERIIPDKIKQIGNRKLLLIAAIIILLLFLIIIIMAALLGSVRNGSHNLSGSSSALHGSGGGCTTSECLHLAGYLADNMDTSVSPCEDFHRYACGGFRKRFHLAPDQREITMVEKISDEIEERLREIIEKPSSGEWRTTSERKLTDFYLSCIHDFGRTKEAGKVLVNLLVEKLTGWYVLNPSNWNENGWNRQEAIARVQGDLAVTVFFEAYMQHDYRRKRNILFLYPGGTGMWYTYYENSDTTGVQDAYKDYMRRVAALLLRDANVTISPGEEETRVEQFVSDVFDMENRMAAGMLSLQKRGLLNQRVTTTLGEIDRNISQLNWMNMVSTMFEDMPLTESSELRILGLSYFYMLNELLKNMTEANTVDRVLNNYLAWRVARRYSSELSWEYRESVMRFKSTVYGETEMEPTWKTCMNTVHMRLGTLLAMEFIRSHLAPDARAEVNELVGKLRSLVNTRISQISWMDDVTRERAIEKINSAKTIVGYSEMYYNETAMEELHSTLEIDRSAGYFRNLLSLNKFQRSMRVRLLLNPEGAEFIDHLPLLGSLAHYWVEPYYISYYNSLFIPAGVMLDPMYNTKRPQIFNYGILGTLLAGKYFEAIGPLGRYGRIDGDYSIWWSNSTTEQFTKISQCLVNYFNGITLGPFTIEDQNITIAVSGNLQVRKLVDDLGGIRAAFSAYKDWTDNNGYEALPVGSSLTHDQLFFVAAAQTKCYVRTDEEAYDKARMGILPEDVELNNLLSHIPEFTTAYQCPVGSKMRISDPCEAF